MICGQCGAPTDRIVDDKALCIFCEDGVVNPAAAKKISPHPPTTTSLPKEKKMKIRKAEPGEPACACGNVLRSDNKTGICKTCRKSGAMAEPASRTTPPRKLKATPRLQRTERSNGHTPQIPLTEPVVDRLIASFSFEQRVAMLRNFLEA